MRHPMKKVLLLLAALTYAEFDSAQNVAADTVPALPPYVYCEIMADHLPTYRDSGVLFDFGQKVGATKYNYLTDAAGNKLLFSSGIEALNYMVCRGWEFVQAYASGDNNGLTHYPPAHRTGPADRGTARSAARPAGTGETEAQQKAITRKRVLSGALFHLPEDLLFRHTFRILAG